MARHRINEGGHLIWFDSDEEYSRYLKIKKRAEWLFVLIGIAIFFIFIIIKALGDVKDETTNDCQTKSEQVSIDNKAYKKDEIVNKKQVTSGNKTQNTNTAKNSNNKKNRENYVQDSIKKEQDRQEKIKQDSIRKAREEHERQLNNANKKITDELNLCINNKPNKKIKKSSVEGNVIVFKTKDTEFKGVFRKDHLKNSMGYVYNDIPFSTRNNSKALSNETGDLILFKFEKESKQYVYLICKKNGQIQEVYELTKSALKDLPLDL